MGEVRVPARRAVAGPDPARRRELPDQRHPPRARHLRALAQVKAAAAVVNARARGPRRATSPRRSAAAAARSPTATTTTTFPIDVFQTGSGTSSNMNMNEVLASLAAAPGRRGAPQRPRQRQPVQQRHLPHLDPRGRGDRRRPTDLVPALDAPRVSVRGQGRRSSPTVVKSGRTHLMDATPVMLGQEFGGYAAHLPARRRAARGDAAPGGRAAAGRHRGRHRHQHPRGLRGRGHRGARVGDRAAVHRGPQPLRGAGRPRRAGRAVRPAAGDRGRPHQDLQRPALDGVGPHHRAWPRSTCPTCSRARASCPAR